MSKKNGKLNYTQSDDNYYANFSRLIGTGI